ncbi:lipopolysaccharide transport periplasmic protein LptA [Rhodoferax sp. PAMC 29310]|uniref:lipopolysaccharide transport periplasmic protein LptA n=1 Tax=Rhodoferax sp. PAMC 29310 TaxID=2822760 RepID=UPI001B335486|nr:lipopolysaccharide transport periplasmic protein LptA [Rhodoferax sp. PAMC 29310]
MKITLTSLFLVVCLALSAGQAYAEKADRDKPMNIEADSLRYDDQRQTSVFTGRVVLTKGTILIRGAKIDVKQDSEGNQFGLVLSEPNKQAFFRQKREGVDEYIEGEGDTIEYDSRADTVKFLTNAKLRRYRGATLSDEFTGGVIQYNNSTDVFTIDGSVTKTDGVKSGRVRAMLTPKSDSGTPKGALAPLVPALRSTTTMGTDKK